MDAETLYRHLGRLIESAPAAPQNSNLSPELMKWVGQATALVNEGGDLVLQMEIQSAIGRLQYPDRVDAYRKILIVLYKSLAAAELKAPAATQGAFIPVGNAFDAYASLAKILGEGGVCVK